MVKRVGDREVGLNGVTVVFDYYRCHNLTLIFTKSFDALWMQWC